MSVPLADEGWGPSQDGARAPAPASAPAPRQRLLPTERRLPFDPGGPLHLLPGRGPSEHLGADLERTVQINDRAARYPRLASVMPLPTGALVIQRHHLIGDTAVQTTFAMRKEPPGSSPGTRDWAFLVIDAEGRVAAEGELTLCNRCHLEAPHDGLFGPP